MRLRLALPALAGLLLAPALYAAPAAAAGDLTVMQLAVGQNDAAVFRGPCGEIGVLDAGDGSADEVAAALGASTPTWLAVSHYNSDHIGDVADLTAAVPVVFDRGGGAAKDTAS